MPRVLTHKEKIERMKEIRASLGLPPREEKK